MLMFNDYEDCAAFLAREFPGVKTYLDGGEFVVEDCGDKSQDTIAYLDVDEPDKVKITLMDGTVRVVDWRGVEP
jgi:hypothetical protein